MGDQITSIMKFKNTLHRRSVRYLVFKDGDVFFGVALEFNIVVEAAHPTEALLLLHEAAMGYLESARKTKARPHILNQKTDLEYERMWQAHQDQKLKKKYERMVGSLPVFSTGRLELARA